MSGQPPDGRRAILRDLVDCFAARDLLSYASAIAFQVLVSLVPLTLVAVAVVGFAGLEDVWRSDLRPDVRDAVSRETFALLDRTVQEVLTSKRLLWLTLGLLLALWQVSSAIRAAAGPLNVVYEVEEDRPWRRRMAVSLGLALLVLPLALTAGLLMAFGGELSREVGLGPVGLLVRWVLTVAALMTVVWLMLRFASAASPAARWASLGSALVVGGWVLAALGYNLYLREIAAYGTVYGNLASVFVMLSVLYLLAVVFLGGVQLDALLRRRHAAGPPGDPDADGS